MENWLFYQSKVTNVLRNTDEQIFITLAEDYSIIAGTLAEVSIIKEEEFWSITYSFPQQSLSRVNIKLHDPKKLRYKAGFSFEEPLVEIQNIYLFPQGTGVGTRLINRLIEVLNKSTSFRRIILRAECERAAKFWNKLGFEYLKEKNRSHMPSMYLNLLGWKKEKKSLKINLNYNLTD